jgi:uncharacterized repeat protein (TIGR01451 family)
MKTIRAMTGIAAVSAAVFPLCAADLRAATGTPDSAARTRIDSAYGKLPLQFEANQGQQPAQVKFLSRGQDYTVFLTPDGVVLSLRKVRQQIRIDQPEPPVREPKLEAAADLRLRLEGSNPAVKLAGAGKLPGAVNYFAGKDPANWRTNVKTYSTVWYQQVYPGIDLVFYGNQKQLEYDFRLAPGTTPDAIRLSVEGAGRTSVDEATGDLVLQAAGEEIRFHKPVVYQPEGADAPRREVDGRFHVNHANHANNDQVTFEVASYDHARELVIDPVLAYSTFLGGSSEDYATAVAVDKSGNAYISGYTCSTNFPTTPGSYSPTPPVHGSGTGCNGVLNDSGSDVFVTKLNPAGTTRIYSTYLGGSYYDYPASIAVDSAGDAYVAGTTGSSDFPVTNGSVCAPVNINTGSCNFAIESSCSPISSNLNGFVTKLNPAGSALLWSTFIGGTGQDEISAMALDSSGDVYVAGNTNSLVGVDVLCPNNPQVNFPWPTTAGAYEPVAPTNGWQTNPHQAFTKLSADGSTMMYSTLFGAPTNPSVSTGGTAYFTSIVVDSDGKAYIGGETTASTFPTTAGAYQTVCAACLNQDNQDGFIVAFDPSQSGPASLLFSTFLGGNGTSPAGTGCPYPDGVYAIALDSSDNIYVTGSACSVDFPTTAGAYQKTDPKPGTGDCNTSNAFLSKLNSTGSTLEHSTFLNGTSCTGQATGYGVSVDSAGNAYVAGFTNDPAFPTLNPLQAPGNGGVFVAELNRSAAELLFSTTLGNGGTDTGYGIHADNYGNVYVAGITAGVSFPTTPGAVQTTYGGDFDDGFVTRIALTQADLAVTNSAHTTVLTGAHLAYTVAVTNNGPSTAYEVTVSDSVPRGTAFLTASTTAGSCKTPAVGATSGKVTCTSPSLADGAGFTVTLVVKVDAPSGNTLSDTATVGSLVFDPTAANNSARAITTVN